jgi:DNA repair protein RadC
MPLTTDLLFKQLSELAKETPAITSPSEAAVHFARFARSPVEQFFLATLDGAHQLIKIHVITKGLVNRTLVHPREIFRPAIVDRAAAIMIGHNHPTGRLTPSAEDRDVTGRLFKASQVIGIPLLDHLIVSKKGFYSFNVQEPELFE